MSKSRADVGDFFVVELLGETGFGTLAGFLGFGFVNTFRFDRHVGHDGNMVASDFHKSFPDGKEVILAALAHADFASGELSDERNVHRDMAFIETCVKSAASGKWTKFPKL